MSILSYAYTQIVCAHPTVHSVMTVTKVMNIIEQYLMAQGYEYRRLDGSTPEAKRVQLVKEFNRDASLFIFLISTK